MDKPFSVTAFAAGSLSYGVSISLLERVLRANEQAFRRYRIRGREPLQRRIDQAVGAAPGRE